MNLDKLFVKKEEGDKSVTLTLLLASFVALLVGAGLEMAGVIKSTSILPELFYANAALYAGRKFQSKTASISLDENK